MYHIGRYRISKLGFFLHCRATYYVLAFIAPKSARKAYLPEDALGHGKASEVRMGVEAEVEVEEAVILLCTRLDEVECTRTIIT